MVELVQQFNSDLPKMDPRRCILMFLDRKLRQCGGGGGGSGRGV